MDRPALSHLIIVCCHAIWLGGDSYGKDEREWAIESFQSGETPTFINHIRAGVEAHRSTPGSMLVFAGGPTKQRITNISEGDSYLSLAFNIYPNLPRDFSVVAETLSTDSFQNVLLSLLLFCSKVARPPESITIVSHAFKRTRFMEQHCRTLRWPVSKAKYVGIDPPKSDEDSERQIETGEAKARLDWDTDWWGRGCILGAKRMKRGWSDHNIASHDWIGNGWKKDLLVWDGGQTMRGDFPHAFLWEGDAQKLVSVKQ